MSTPVWESVLAPNLGPRFHEFYLFLSCLRLEPPILGKFWGPFWGLKLDPKWSWRRRQLSTSSIVLAVKTHTHCVVRRSHQLPTAVGEPWGYVDMVLASMRFPDLSLGPYKRDSLKKTFCRIKTRCYGVNCPVL